MSNGINIVNLHGMSRWWSNHPLTVYEQCTKAANETRAAMSCSTDSSLPIRVKKKRIT